MSERKLSREPIENPDGGRYLFGWIRRTRRLVRGTPKRWDFGWSTRRQANSVRVELRKPNPSGGGELMLVALLPPMEARALAASLVRAADAIEYKATVDETHQLGRTVAGPDVHEIEEAG